MIELDQAGKREGISLAIRGLLLLVALTTLLLGNAYAQAGDDEKLGKVSVAKSANYIGNGKVSISVQITNVGKVPVSQISINEYFNKELSAVEKATLSHNGTSSKVVLAQGGGPVAQAILDVDPELSLAPSERITLLYEVVTPLVGDFLVPTTLVTYAFQFGRSTIGTNIYSNGLLVHIPSGFELMVQSSIPYAIASGSGIVIFTVLRQMYKYFKEDPRRLPFRR